MCISRLLAEGEQAEVLLLLSLGPLGCRVDRDHLLPRHDVVEGVQQDLRPLYPRRVGGSVLGVALELTEAIDVVERVAWPGSGLG